MNVQAHEARTAPARTVGLVAGILAAAAVCVIPWGSARAQNGPVLLGTTVDGLLAASHSLSPALRAAVLNTAAASAKARGADALDDPTIADSYSYYKNPGVFSGHTVMVTQAFPLWGKRGLRRDAALADVTAARGRERATQDELDEKIKVAYAQYFLTYRDITVNREVTKLALRLRGVALARYGLGRGDQTGVIQALGEQTTARTEAVRLDGELRAARAHLNVLVGRPPDAPLAEPLRLRPVPTPEPMLAMLVARAHAANPMLSAAGAEIDAAQERRTLADKAWYPDITVGAGPLIQTNHQPVGFAATVGFNIPVPWGRERSGQQEAAAQLGASQQQYDASLLEIEGALGEALAKLHAARNTEALLRREASPQARATFQSIIVGYGQGTGDLTAGIAAEHQIHDVEISLLQSQLEEQVQLAAIERLIGGAL